MLFFFFNRNDAEAGTKPNGTAISPSSTLLIGNHQKPSSVLRAELLGNYKGFSIKPLQQPVNEAATGAESRAPTRPAPSAPPYAQSAERPQIGQPVLDATTSSAVRELVSVPLKPAPPVPSTRPVSMVTTNATVDYKHTGGGGGGGYPTLRRITSFMKNQKQPDEKKNGTTSARVNTKFNKEVLKNLEISQPILQNEINVPAEPLPLEADQHRAVVLRAQSLRTVNNTKHRPSIPNFGSMRGKRPISVALAPVTAVGAAGTSRPTSPPPQPPPPLQQHHPLQSSYQIPRTLSSADRRNDENPVNRPRPPHPNDERDDEPTNFAENIYSVIDESPAATNDYTAYKVPKSLETSLLGEIVSAIQERNQESIYTSNKSAASDDGPPPTALSSPLPPPQQQQTYENFCMPSPVGSTTSSGYMRPVDVKSRATAAYDRPDLVKNCDDNRSLNRSPDVLAAKNQPSTAAAAAAADKPTVAFPKPTALSGVAKSPFLQTATVGLKKKLSDARRQPSSKTAVTDGVQKRFGNAGSKKPPPVAVKPSTAAAAGKR